MSALLTSLEVIDKFISIARELAKLPALLLPQYQTAACDMYEICQKLLAANENVSRWLYRFLYFNYRQQDARGAFMAEVKEYKSMKAGPTYYQLKFRCGDIGNIYHRDIESKLAKWFSRSAKREQVQGIFTALTEADQEMVAFTYDYVLAKLDDLVTQSEQLIDAGNMDAAEAIRLRCKSEMGPVTGRLEKFSGELADLVMQFARIARVPVTLSARS